ncbi:MAG: nucleotidyl transferase AbiEii/AbiGii toxin family protein [Candidatus Micrarchaeia archaeon]
MNADELSEYAQKRGLNLGQAEKDYYQNIVLFVIYQKAKSELVFKGGTALAKCFGLNRFSEDLDFTATGKIGCQAIVADGLKAFGIASRIKSSSSHEGGESFMAKIEGPLYRNSEKTLCSITVEMSFRETPCEKPEIAAIGHHMDIIPVFDVFVMRDSEIMAEKVRAVMERDSARDIYDLCFLIDRGVVPTRECLEKKLALAGLEPDYEAFARRCRAKRKIWKPELSSLVRNVPEFDACLSKALDFYKRDMGALQPNQTMR